MTILDLEKRIVKISDLEPWQQTVLRSENKGNAKETYLKEFLDEKMIIDWEDGTFSTFDMLVKGSIPQDIRVDHGPEMFLKAYEYSVIKGYGNAIAVDAKGEIVAILKNEPTSYVHQYKQTGMLDLWLLDSYDCIFLHDCNEYSVILIQETLAQWQGKRIILVGCSWEKMIPFLQLPAVEIHYEETLTTENMMQLLSGVEAPLQIMFGHPHNEPLDRLQDGILYYAEVMALCYLFSDYRSYGEKNPDINFFIVDGRYGNLGLFALLDSVLHIIRYGKARGFTPVVRITKSENSFYSDGAEDDIWSKFFCQPEEYTLAEVMESKNVYVAPGFYNGRVMNYILDMVSDEVVPKEYPVWPNGLYNQDITTYVRKQMEQFLPHPEETVGVLARGTDYVNTRLANHAIHATKEQIAEKIDEILEKDASIKYIYLATEDATYCPYFKKRYGDKVTFTDQERYTVSEGQMLADLHRESRGRRKGFDFGAEYVASVMLLSKCRRMIASGSCGGVGEALRLNDGKFEDVFVFDLGCNPG